MPTLLYINTAEKHLEIALSLGEQLFIWDSTSENTSQAQMINVAIDDLLTKTGKSLKQLDAIVICGGPGSYTGLRVGLSTAKGICFALNLPLIMISSLELALISSLEHPINESLETILTIKEAREEEAFVRISKGVQTLFMNHVFHKDLLDLQKEFQFTSIFANEVPESLSHLPSQGIKNTNWKAWNLWAIDKYVSKSFADLAYAEPYYLKDVYITTSKKRPF